MKMDYFFIKVVVAICFAILMKGTQSQTSTDTLCKNVVATLDCSLDTPRNICATNGVTYPSGCDFAKVHCQRPDVHIKYEGSCLESDAVGDSFCRDLLSYSCPVVSSPVCANDNKTYDNFCRYQQAKCSNKDLQLALLGVCPTPPPVTTTTISVFELICQGILNTPCPDNQPQVCGSDGVTYDSGCDLEKANCIAASGVTLDKTGPC
ncbi:agrin [Aplysia californica]|uniref:Agrin n=1 Tax=Aplysia californica TaxID=6500 RepID=A0ABM0JZC8_APLCA|nr:agrin [Aplysia californica]